MRTCDFYSTELMGSLSIFVFCLASLQDSSMLINQMLLLCFPMPLVTM
jgi:hypothetical protein